MPALRAWTLALALVALLPPSGALRPNLDTEQTALLAEDDLVVAGNASGAAQEPSSGSSAAITNTTKELAQVPVNATVQSENVTQAAPVEESRWYYLVPPVLMAMAAAALLHLRSEEGDAPKHVGNEQAAAHSVASAEIVEEVSAVHFKDPDAEEKYQQYCHEPNLKSGARLMAAATVAVALERVKMIIDRHECQGKIHDSVQLSYACTFVVLGVVLVLCLVAAKQPRDQLYWPLVAFFAVASVALNLPPFAFNCQELIDVANASCSPHLNVMMRKSDCELQGHTAMQMMITFLLMLPYILPRFSLMHLGWGWIATFFIGTTIFRKQFVNDFNKFDNEDLAMHTAMLSITLLIAIQRKYRIEREQRNQFLEDGEEKSCSEKLYHIFEEMVPHHVIVPMLKGDVIAEQVDKVSILFIVINDFDHFASSKTPKDLLTFLNTFFSKMDKICEDNRVTKIETVADEYVCCVGVVPADQKAVEENPSLGHGLLLERLFRAAEQILQLQEQEVQFKMGMHSGPIVAGVIGKKLPRFRLFGDTINTAARMMQKCLPGQVQFGDATKAELPPSVPIKLRGEVEMKGKGMVTAYVLDTSPGKRPSEGPTAEAAKTVRASKRASTLQLVQLGKEPPRTSQLSMSVDNEVPEAEDFDQIVNEITRPDIQEAPQKSTLLSERAGFTDELEGEYQKWFHENTFSFAFTNRMDVVALILALVTTGEALHMESIHIWSKPNGMNYSSSLRFPVFLATRFVCFLILVGWRFAPRSSWFHDNARVVQFSFLASCCLVAGLLFASYDALMIRGISKDEASNLKKEAPFNQQLSLVFLLMFFIVTSSVPMLFFPSCTWMFVSLVLMQYRTKTSIYFSRLGLVLFVLSQGLTALLGFELEQSSRRRFKAKHQIAEAKDRINHIVNTLMPPLVVKELRDEPQGSLILPSHTFKAATITQSDLCGFTQLASTKTPREVVAFISDLFGRFDSLTEWHFHELREKRDLLDRDSDMKERRGIYKVETIGDAYIAGQAEKPLTIKNSPVEVLLFGLDMIRATAEWAEGLGVQVTCRVGVHHGECVGGIVGTGMMRYHLFGQFMTQLDTLEATSQEGVVQVSNACKEAIERELRAQGRTPEEVFGSFELREQEHLRTSKGEVHEFEEVGGRTCLVRQKPVA